jgi:hypothetical protein
MEELSESICHQFTRLKDARSVLDSHCQEIAERMLPYHANFNTTRTMGEKRSERIFDSTAALALTRFTAAFTSMVTPEGQTWHRMATNNRDLNKIIRVRDYYDQVVEILFRLRYRGGFGSQVQECWTSLGAFGTTSMLVDQSKTGGLYYKSLPLTQTWFAENNEGFVDTCYRSFKFTARQAVQQFGDKAPKVCKEAVDTNPYKEFEFLHFVGPNTDYRHGRMGADGMAYMSVYICMAEKERVVSRGGYNTIPIIASRFMTIAGEPYGYSPAMTVLAENKMLNEMEKCRIKAAQQLTNPPWLVADDLMGNPLSFKPDSINYGGVNSEGRQMVVPMVSGANPSVALEITDQKRRVINDAFFVNLFQILVESHTMSATEVIERAREKGALLSPTFSRQNSEFIGRIVEREVDVLSRMGMLPPMPPELVEAQGEYEVVFDNPLARAQKSEQLSALARTMEMIMPIAQIDNSVLMNYDFDEISRDVPEITGMPARWIRSAEAVAQIRAQQQQQQQEQQYLEAAPVLAEVRRKEQETQQMAMSGAIGRA